MKQVIDLSNKRILIAGASSGIGAETAKLCSQLGAKVILVARRKEKLQEVLGSLDGANHCCFSYDLSNIDGIETFTKSIIEQTGPLDGYVHSVGTSGTRPLKMYKPKAMREIMELNFNSFVEVARCITMKNAFNQGLSIVGISSVSSIIGSKGKVGYCASKAAMDAAVRCMAKELASYGVRANTICPGIIETAIFEEFKKNAGESKDAQAKLDRQYLGLGQPIDVANMIVYLLSDASHFITGANIGVDGGMLSS